MSTDLNIPSPILIFGDPYISKNNIVSIKKKYPNIKWVTLSMEKNTLDEIRAEIGIDDFFGSTKIIIVQDIEGNKAARNFIISLCNNCPSSTKIIIWDSGNSIKIDPKTKTFQKSWTEFLSEFKKIPNNKIINNGEQLTEKQNIDCFDFVKKYFEKKGKIIDSKDVKLLVNIVGYDRGLLASDIDKMCITSPQKINSKFILDNAFPTFQESVLYKFSNVLDEGSYEECINATERFLDSDVNPNVISEILLRKARWRMIATYYWSKGLIWSTIENKLMEIGKFPALVWHNPNLDSGDKKRMSEQFQSPEGITNYICFKQGIPNRYLKTSKKKDKSEAMPFGFMATQVVDFIKEKVVGQIVGKADKKNIDAILNKAIQTYLFVNKKVAEVRYGKNQFQDLQEMIKVLTNVRINL
jgi:DNA polymerase III delta subunit